MKITIKDNEVSRSSMQLSDIKTQCTDSYIRTIALLPKMI